MLEKSETDVAQTLKTFNSYQLDVALLVPTPTGLSKSIMDATGPVRTYLMENGVHDFERQGQGQENKVVLSALFVGSKGFEETSVSLYRPETKKGDPRIWFSGLGKYAEPFNLLAVLFLSGKIYLVNCSRNDVMRSIGDPNSPLGRLAGSAESVSSGPAEELLSKLKEVSGKGFIKTLRPGPTGVGMTLETELGIAANSSRAPDFRGIELKAGRVGKRSKTRTTLFSKVPAWKLSPVGSAMGLLEKRGRVIDERLQLYHELNGVSPNSYGLLLQIDTAPDWLKQVHVESVTGQVTHDTTWEMPKLRKALADKHRETFWVEAETVGSGENEAFHYVLAKHTVGPRIRNFDALLECGIITLDYTMHQKSSGGVRDHGYLFKIHPDNISALFPPPRLYALAA